MNNIGTLEVDGLTRKQLIGLFGKDRVHGFLLWMRGQTVSIIESRHVYYYFDISRFFKLYDANEVDEE